MFRVGAPDVAYTSVAWTAAHKVSSGALQLLRRSIGCVAFGPLTIVCVGNGRKWRRI